MTDHVHWQDEQNRFEERVAENARGGYEVHSDRDGTVLLAVSEFDAFEGDYGIGTHLMLVQALEQSGPFVRYGDWGRTEGVLRRGTQTLALPETKSEGRSARTKLLGIAVAPERVKATLQDERGLEALLPAASSLHNDPLVEAVMIAMWRDAQAHGLSSAFFDHGLDLILRRFVEGGSPLPAEPVAAGLSPGQLSRALEFIESRLGTDLSVREIAEEAGRDVRGLTRAFKASTGYTPYEFLTMRRMERAKVLLATRQTVMEIALDVGYANPAKFAAAFKRFCGCTPTEWRRRLL
ncbi:AraC family transcriptional regulator [Kiloniella sp. b19]|uniref:AraC family transcriptional regulator n=1 Tax=Kiloniella sp. GXU_MW_B19 TaxID=3141326 RepID=UPI0031D5475E